MKKIIFVILVPIVLYEFISCNSIPNSEITEKDSFIIYQMNLSKYERQIEKDPNNYKLYYERGYYYSLSGYYD